MNSNIKWAHLIIFFSSLVKVVRMARVAIVKFLLVAVNTVDVLNLRANGLCCETISNSV